MGKATIGHLDPEFQGLMEDIKDLMRYTFRTSNALTLPLSAPGSAAMEASFANLLEPGDKAVVCINGVFGMRMAENVRRMGGELVTVEDDWWYASRSRETAQRLGRQPRCQSCWFCSRGDVYRSMQRRKDALCAG